MQNAKKILIISDTNYKPIKIYLDQMPKLAKGFIRLGHDVRNLSYCGILSQLSPFKSRSLSSFLFKRKTDKIIAKFAKHYKPDIVYISFAKHLDITTLMRLREAAPSAVFVGGDGDPWPSRQKGRIETARQLDILLATNDGSFLDEYRRASVKKCVFMPNLCDPDIDHRYEVGPKWKTDILWTGLIRHDPKRYPTEPLRYELVGRLAQMSNCTVYGCCGRPDIGGIDYLYAISGAKIGLSINGDNNVRLYHSDRLTHYLSCGTFVLSRTVPDSDLLFKDGVHLRYFDTADEFFELADWFLKHDDERKKMADAGMKWTHEQFNCVKIAGFILDLVEKGKYSAPWNPAL